MSVRIAILGLTKAEFKTDEHVCPDGSKFRTVTLELTDRHGSETNVTIHVSDTHDPSILAPVADGFEKMFNDYQPEVTK